MAGLFGGQDRRPALQRLRGNVAAANTAAAGNPNIIGVQSASDYAQRQVGGGAQRPTGLRGASQADGIAGQIAKLDEARNREMKSFTNRGQMAFKSATFNEQRSGLVDQLKEAGADMGRQGVLGNQQEANAIQREDLGLRRNMAQNDALSGLIGASAQPSSTTTEIGLPSGLPESVVRNGNSFSDAPKQASDPAVDGRARGGKINGPGTSKSDSIPAYLSDGEYVLPAETVEQLGTQNLNQLVRATTGDEPGPSKKKQGMRDFGAYSRGGSVVDEQARMKELLRIRQGGDMRGAEQAAREMNRQDRAGVMNADRARVMEQINAEKAAQQARAQASVRDMQITNSRGIGPGVIEPEVIPKRDQMVPRGGPANQQMVPRPTPVGNGYTPDWTYGDNAPAQSRALVPYNQAPFGSTPPAKPGFFQNAKNGLRQWGGELGRNIKSVPGVAGLIGGGLVAADVAYQGHQVNEMGGTGLDVATQVAEGVGKNAAGLAGGMMGWNKANQYTKGLPAKFRIPLNTVAAVAGGVTGGFGAGKVIEGDRTLTGTDPRSPIERIPQDRAQAEAAAPQAGPNGMQLADQDIAAAAAQAQQPETTAAMNTRVNSANQELFGLRGRMQEAGRVQPSSPVAQRSGGGTGSTPQQMAQMRTLMEAGDFAGADALAASIGGGGGGGAGRPQMTEATSAMMGQDHYESAIAGLRNEGAARAGAVRDPGAAGLRALRDNPEMRQEMNDIYGRLGNGIQVGLTPGSGTVMFSGNGANAKANYTGADGKPTKDWKDTADYRDAMIRNASSGNEALQRQGMAGLMDLAQRNKQSASTGDERLDALMTQFGPEQGLKVYNATKGKEGDGNGLKPSALATLGKNLDDPGLMRSMLEDRESRAAYLERNGRPDLAAQVRNGEPSMGDVAPNQDNRLLQGAALEQTGMRRGLDFAGGGAMLGGVLAGGGSLAAGLFRKNPKQVVEGASKLRKAWGLAKPAFIGSSIGGAVGGTTGVSTGGVSSQIANMNAEEIGRMAYDAETNALYDPERPNVTIPIGALMNPNFGSYIGSWFSDLNPAVRKVIDQKMKNVTAGG